MTYSHEVEHMCVVKKGPNHGPAPIPEEGKWVKSKEIVDISGLTHGVGWCAPQQGACKLTLNVKEGVIQEALVETIGCSGMTHSAAMAAEILPGTFAATASCSDRHRRRTARFLLGRIYGEQPLRSWRRCRCTPKAVAPLRGSPDARAS